ncbi:sigma-E factor negative regulatory protein [Ferrimonas balearica]|uniref:sigma-E factor negative regulatory protein n=1 Tax=Ferrimonas balearica TaxID=44012 RepID=UPI001C998230|nr:RseA family anti-sigma factor [Ferrimonas balearica]MBY5993491.1 anti-sigma factor [Ferrimonas balearica]
MTERKEKLSAWMDDQPSDGIYQDLLEDAQLSERWHRYHLIGDAMRNELPEHLQLDIAAQVAQSLEAEPAILAPRARRRFALPGKVVEMGQRFGQYAIAATVAAVAVVGVQQYSAEEAVTPLPVLETMPMLGAPSPASYQVPGMGQSQSPAVDKEREAMEQQRRANAFLRDHLLQQRLNSGNSVETAAIREDQ